MVMTRTTKPNTAGHPSPQGVEKYGGVRKAKMTLIIKRDIPDVLAERYGSPVSLHITSLIVEDSDGRRTYSDIHWIKGNWGKLEGVWKEYQFVSANADHDIKIINEMIQATISQYVPKKANTPKIPIEIDIEEIKFDWEILKNSEERLWAFEVVARVRYHWENGIKSIKLAIKFPEGEIDVHPLTKVYWENWIVNAVAEFIRQNDLFAPQAYLTKGGE